MKTVGMRLCATRVTFAEGGVARWAASKLIALTLALCAAPLVHSGVAVSAGGQATYGVPISVPPGIAGMAPNLSLSYVDGGINGPLGVGWSLQGVSSITRCPSSKFLDGKSRGVDFTWDDRLCLDGQRLIPLSAAAMQVGSISQPVSQPASQAAGIQAGTLPNYVEFRTEKDMFARIRAYGTAKVNSAVSAANGPAYFKVWSKAGQIYEYGPAGNTDENGLIVPSVISGGTTPTNPVSLAASVWPVTRISDVAGNYIDFRYGQRNISWGSGVVSGGDVGHEWYLSEIQYTGNSKLNQLPTNRVVLQYQERAAPANTAHDRAEAIQSTERTSAY
jgi:hypothetical protein